MGSFLQFYDLSAQPFGFNPDPSLLYETPTLREASASIRRAIELNLGFAALIGLPGTGKTSLLVALLRKYAASSETALILHPHLDQLEILRYIMRELDLPDFGQDKVASYVSFRDFVASSARKGKRVLVVLDEAQETPNAALEELRLLSNFETVNLKTVNVVLSGQPNLADKLACTDMTALRQRIPVLARIEPLTSAETARYVEHRLRIAGYAGSPIFTENALQRIYALSGGVPRSINSICFNALSLGCATRCRVVDTDLLGEVAADLSVARESEQRSSPPRYRSLDRGRSEEPHAGAVARSLLMIADGFVKTKFPL